MKQDIEIVEVTPANVSFNFEVGSYNVFYKGLFQGNRDTLDRAKRLCAKVAGLPQECEMLQVHIIVDLVVNVPLEESEDPEDDIHAVISQMFENPKWTGSQIVSIHEERVSDQVI